MDPNNKSLWNRRFYVTGIILIIIGALDPMEGSILIELGSLLLTITTQLSKDRHKFLFLICFLLISIGFFSLWFISALGGFNPKTEWWWLVLILPYPIGWLSTIILLITRAFNKTKVS